MRLTALLLAAALAACATKTESTSDSAAMGAGDTGADADVAANGQGIPAGYTVITDDTTASLSSIRYEVKDGSWDVTTGPAHIIFADRDSASGVYTASATFAQLEAPRHPEAYGLIVGGRDLRSPNRGYTYFVVRGTGEFLVRVREGGQTRDVMKWTANAALPKQDKDGKATYRLAIRVAADSVRFLANDTQVAAVRAGAVPTTGVAGLRINHNLHVLTAPVTISR